MATDGPGGTFYIIDGYAQFFRAYHAIRTPMSSPFTNEPTHMTYGYVGMLLKLLRDYGPDHLAVAMDVSGDRGTFRTELYPEYKANRDAPPSDLKPQVDRCLELMRSMRIPIYGIEGYEADDVIATIVRTVRRCITIVLLIFATPTVVITTATSITTRVIRFRYRSIDVFRVEIFALPLNAL